MLADTLAHYMRGARSAAFVSLLGASSLALPRPARGKTQKTKRRKNEDRKSVV